MTDPQAIVNKLLEGDPDDPRAYLDWLGQKVETGPLEKIRFGAHIHLSDEDMIRDNAREAGIDVDSQAFWDEVERCMAIMESHCLQLLREAGLHVSDEGHDETGARVASVWIDTPEEDRKLALLKAVINWSEGDWPSTTSGTMDYAFGADTTQRIYAATEDAARFIDVTIEFTGTDALVEWSRLNLNEAVTGDPDDPEVFLKSYANRNPWPELTKLCQWIKERGLNYSGRVERTGRYVHQNSTDFTLDVETYRTDLTPEQENEVNTLADAVQAGIQEEIRDTINERIYRALEREWDYRTSDTGVDEFITGNEYHVNAQGDQLDLEGGDNAADEVPFEQLDDTAKEHAREWARDIIGNDQNWHDYILEEWQEELGKMGFEDAKIDYSGFWSQGDGASFTCPRFDIFKFAEFFKYGPPTERGQPYTDQLYVKEAADPDDPEVFLRSYVPRMMGRVFIDFDTIKPHFPDAPANWVRDKVNGLDLFRYNRVTEMREVLRQMKSDYRQRGPNVPVDVITYRYKVPNPQGSSIVRGWLDKIGCPVPVIQWLCETNAPTWFFVTAKEFNAYMQMVYPQVKLESVTEGIDDPPVDLVNRLTPKVQCPKCGATAELGYGADKLDTHPTAPIEYDTDVPIARYLDPADEHNPNVSIHHFDTKHIYKCRGCGERFDGTLPGYAVESVDDPDDPQSFLKSYRKIYYKLFYGSKFGEGAFVGVYDSLDAVVQAAKERKLRKRARHVWATEEAYPDAPEGVVAGSEPTGFVYDILKGYTVAEPRRVVVEGVDDPDDPEMFIKRFKPRWDLFSHIKNGHFYFKDEAGRIAVADYSMRNQRDPASSDDGLLVLDKTKPITRYRGIGGKKMWHIPITQYYGGLGDKPIPSATGASEEEMADLRPKLEALGWTFQIREEDEDIDPKQYLDATTGWIDTFLNAGMQPDTSGGHEGQFWKRYECHGFNYIVVVNSRVPRFMLVERNDALYGTNTFRRVFEYPERDINGLVTEFTALNRLLTKALTSAFDGFPAFDEKVEQLYKQHERRRKRWLSGKVKESLDEPEQYLKGNVYTLDELRDKLQNYGLSFPSNGIKPWGRWAVIDGFTYWAVYSKDPEKWLPQSYFREQLEKFCKDMGFTVYHIQLFGEYPEGITFKLAVPKMQIDPEAYGAQERRLNDPDFDNERQAHEIIQRDWLPEGAPMPPEDDPTHYVSTAHTDMKRVIPSLGFKKPDPGHNFGDNHYFFYGHDNNNDFSDRYTLTITDYPKDGHCIVCGWRRGEASHCTSVSYDELIPYITRLKQILDTTYRADVQSALKRAKVQEALDVPLPPEDEPAPNIEKHAQHVEKVEADAIESAILNATNEFDTLVRLRNINNAQRADELAAELGAKWAETAGYPNGSDEFDMVVSAVNNHCGEMFPGQWEDYPESDYPFQEALDDPDDPQAFLQHMETDWRKILRKHGFKPHPHSDHLSYTLEYPDRVWGANWPMRIYAGHGWNPEPEFQYDHPDPDNPDLDAEDAAYEQWERDHGLAAEINRRDVNFPHYVYFQFGREYYRRVEVPTNKLDNFLTRLIRGAKKIVGTERIDHDHPETSDLTTMLWNLAKQIASELQIPLKESLDAPSDEDINPEAYLHHLTQINLADLYQQYDLQSNDEGNYGHGLMELGKPATLVWHGKTHTIEKVNLAIHTHPFRQVVSVSIYIHPISNEASWRTLKGIKWHFWSVPVEELRDVVHKMIFEIEGVCLVNDLTWPEMVVQFKTAMKRFRPYRPLVAKKKKVVEGVDDPTPEFLQAAFDVPAILKRMGYERSTREVTPFEWFKVFHRMPAELDIMVEVKRRGLGGEENEADIVYDITVYRYPVNDNPGREWVPVAYRYERNNKQLERVLLKLEDRIRRNDLRGIRDEVAESVPEPPPEDDPTDVLKSHEQNLLPAELKRLEFGPKPEQGKEWIYGVELPRYWWNRYQAADGKIHGLYIYFIGGQTPEVRANNWNFDAKAWFQRGNAAPTDSPAQSEAHFCAIIRDLDAAMKRSAADSLSPEQEHEAIDNVLKHHRKWWDDTLDYLINTKGGTVPGRMGPGQPA